MPLLKQLLILSALFSLTLQPFVNRVEAAMEYEDCDTECFEDCRAATYSDPGIAAGALLLAGIFIIATPQSSGGGGRHAHSHAH